MAQIIAPKKDRAKKAHKGETVMSSGIVPKNTKYTPSKRARELPEKTEWSLC